jgi:hypothetical protein
MVDEAEPSMCKRLHSMEPFAHPAESGRVSGVHAIQGHTEGFIDIGAVAASELPHAAGMRGKRLMCSTAFTFLRSRRYLQMEES